MKRVFFRYSFIALAAVFISGVISGLFYLSSKISALENGGLSSYIYNLLGQDAHKKEEKPAAAPEFTIQIPEGWTNRDIGQYFSRLGKWTSEDLYEAVGQTSYDVCGGKRQTDRDWKKEYSFLADKPDCASLEGYLFPDTYRLYASSTVEEAVSRMLDNFDKKLDDSLRKEIKLQGKTINDVIIMASLIEKEAPISYSDKENLAARMISGIFWRRLKNGQRLESDATLSYILEDKKDQHSGEELDNSSPYNTYRKAGLPPGPICNPGLVAIEAAIYPIRSDYNFFLTDQNGNVYYARTYEEHLRNKYKYLR